MSIKLTLLKSGETLITDVKELVTEETEEKERKVHGYLFVKPKKVDLASPVLLTENSDSKEESSVQVSLSSWCLITKDTEFAIAKDIVSRDKFFKNHVVSLMSHIDELSN